MKMHNQIKKIVLLFFLSGCSIVDWMNRYPDSPIEEAVESFIDAETGIDMDLTAKTPEKN